MPRSTSFGQVSHRFLSAGVCRHTVSPLKLDRFPDTRFRQADEEVAWELEVDGSTAPLPRSTSDSSSLSSIRDRIGIAALGELLAVSAARVWISLDLISPSCRWSFCWSAWAIDRTTSPLQMGHVLRLVTNQGVLIKVSFSHWLCEN